MPHTWYRIGAEPDYGAQPELFAAARVSEDLRKTGGYHPDKAVLWARLLEGDRLWRAGTHFPTMYDSPPAGFAEMLLQSQTGAINLLPALPTSWESGEILAFVPGGYESTYVGQTTNWRPQRFALSPDSRRCRG